MLFDVLSEKSIQRSFKFASVIIFFHFISFAIAWMAVLVLIALYELLPIVFLQFAMSVSEPLREEDLEFLRRRICQPLPQP